MMIPPIGEKPGIDDSFGSSSDMSHSHPPLANGWYREGGLDGKAFPTLETAKEAVRTLLALVGIDPKAKAVVDTPARVVSALQEMTEGYSENPAEILGKLFEESCDEVVILRGIPFTSLCEHHLLPFSGTADVGYLPAAENGKVVGLSKLARLVDCFARRLQMQERMTNEIAQSLMTCLSPKGAAVVVRASHTCMACRGVKKSGAEMVTSAMHGIFRDKPEARAEFLELCRR
jgi:GTP cyclohydrolase IA